MSKKSASVSEIISDANVANISNLSTEELKRQLATLKEALKEAKANNPIATRGSAVLELLNSGPHSVPELAEKLSTTSKNISSVLNGLRKAGHVILTSPTGKKFIPAADLLAAMPQ